MSRTLAIGDIHGCIDALLTLTEMVEFQDDDTIVALGDNSTRDIRPARRERCGWMRSDPDASPWLHEASSSPPLK